jgi:polar amino acid transport system substrate-binding protein
MSPEIIDDLVLTGVLRAGINLSNFLLVIGKSPVGYPEGVAPDMASEIARLWRANAVNDLNSPGELADQAGKGVWDVGLIGAEPQRLES